VGGRRNEGEDSDVDGTIYRGVEVKMKGEK
jgi:hypothetical protein